MDALLLIGAIGAAAAGTGAVYQWWVRPILQIGRDIRDFLADLKPLAENQQRILRLLDENGGGWRQQTSKRLEKIESEQVRQNKYLAALCEKSQGNDAR